MLSRRAFIANSSAVAASLLAQPGALAQPVRLPAAAAPNDKGRFLMAAVKQMQDELRAFQDEMARRGIFSSILPPPVILPFGDWDYYYLKEGEAIWWPNEGQTYKQVNVPVGYVSDLASVPSILWSAYPPQGRYAIAAIVHDYLYWVQDRKRAEADDIFFTAMQDTEVPVVTRNAFWLAVRLGAGGAWEENKQKKKAGEKRLLRKFPPNLLTKWVDWKKQPGVFRD